jgi:hypothetical protein
MDGHRTEEQTTPQAAAAAYEPPTVVDYGDIFEITASATSGSAADVFHPGTFRPS